MPNLGLNNYQLPFRPDPALGSEYMQLYNEDKNFNRLMLATVKKVNYQYNTVDFTTISDTASYGSSGDTEGLTSAQIPVDFGGVTSSGNAFGHYRLITVGQTVIIGFLENKKSSPIVLGVYVSNDVSHLLARTTLTSTDDSDEAVQQEVWHDYYVYPSMTYRDIDGHGNIEHSFSGRTFLYITDSDQDQNYVTDNGFDYTMLPGQRYSNGQLIEPVSPYAPTVLFKHGSVNGDHNLQFFVSPQGVMRWSSYNVGDEGITYLELDTDNNFKIRRQFDSIDFDDEDSYYLEMLMLASGSYEVRTTNNKILLKLDGTKPVLGSNDSDDVLGDTEQSAVDKATQLSKDYIDSAMGNVNELLNQINSDIANVKNGVSYKFDLISSSGQYLDSDVTSTSLTVNVYSGSESITSSLAKSAFHWQLLNDAGEHITTWEQANEGVGNSVVLSNKDFSGSCKVSCNIDIELPS